MIGLAFALAAGQAAAPDYARDVTWLCRPGRADACAAGQDVTSIAANGRRKVERFRAARAPQYDCFYVYPTVSLDTGGNSDLVIGDEERRVAALQAARFAATCRVFAPMYRQVTLTALRTAMTGGANPGDGALALADVTAAWRDYLARDNGGRGVVLIGHSQGARLLKELLAREIEPVAAVRRNIVSAMLIGTNVLVPQGSDVGGDLKRMPLCRTGDQYGCVVSYVSFRADAPPPEPSRFGRSTTPGMTVACTNPAALNGGRGAADAIFPAAGLGATSTPFAPWTGDGAATATPFVRVPGLIATECVARGGASYLAVTVNANGADPRADTIGGDVSANGRVLRDWGLHLVDMPVVMGDLVALAERQAAAWRGTPLPKSRTRPAR
ncbi:MAG TPA: DUF3089 domain-containing protein [Sphingomonas sp.]|jgi:hypothetical protein|uniref:DUF3089 domain-containing protein n=1 Tax=Sphingomonas sp. TaxID=28214 RepID=UPI002ED7EDE1